ncbi:MAG TPA: YdeI/OmpD-associated family protein [Bacteroidales bacterium]|nr:YdeI/OmpD-associated family protein [Bacteroidales bacterium]
MSAVKFEFDTVIKKHESLNAGFIEFPYDVKKEFGKGRVKVKALIDGVPYKGSLVKMGGECHWLGITQEIRKATGKNPGDKVHVVIEEDLEERTVEIPDDLMALMNKETNVLEYFNKLSYTHKKEYVRWITEARREETRQNRLAKAIELMKNKIKTPY